MIYTLEDFIREYRKIKEMGWIRTHRAGPTGVGKTLEDLLALKKIIMMRRTSGNMS